MADVYVKIKDLTQETSLAQDRLIEVAAETDGVQNGKIGIGQIFNSSGVPFLNPVVNKAALDSLDSTNLIDGVFCQVISEQRLYQRQSSVWTATVKLTKSTLDPTSTDDINSGYIVGDTWLNTVTQKMYYCVDNSVSAAQWRIITFSGLTFVDTVPDILGTDVGNDSLVLIRDMKSLVYMDEGSGTPGTGNPWTLTRLCKDNAISDPTAENNASQGYVTLSMWNNIITNTAFVCVESSIESAVWVKINNQEPTQDLSPYTGDIDGQGADPNKYASVSSAYTAGRKDLFTTASIIETGDITLSANDSLRVRVGLGYKWSISNHQVTSASGNNGESLTIELAGEGSSFEFSDIPFTNFDPASAVTIIANGGSIYNSATADDKFISINGRLVIKDARFVLPNQSNGGFKTNQISQIDNIIMQGGGESCQRVIGCSGGNINGITWQGTFPDNAILNFASAPTNVVNFNFPLEIPASFLVNGSISNITSAATSYLNLVASNKSSIANGNVASVQLDASTDSIYINNVDFSDSVSLATDNSVSNVFVSNCTIRGDQDVYGINIQFINCYFVGNLTLQTGSTGVLVSCRCDGTFTNSGTFIRRANDSNIGNDSDVIADNSVTYSKIQKVSAGKILGNSTGSLSDVEEIDSTSAGLAILSAADASEQKTLLSLQNVDNTSDVNKPVSTAQQAALDAKINNSEKGAIDGVATLDSNGKLTPSQVPQIAVTQTFLAASEAAQLALTVQEGDVAVRTDESKSYIALNSTNVSMSDWQQLLTPTSSVQSVNGQTGTVVLAKGDVGLGNVDNTSDVNKPVSTAQQAALDLKANLASPALTGNPTATTQSAGDNSTKLATTAYADTAISNLKAKNSYLRYNGVSNSIVFSTGNIASVTRTGTGNYKVNFTSSYSTANDYLVMITGGIGTSYGVDDASIQIRVVTGGYGTSSFSFATVNQTGSSFVDATVINLAIIEVV